MEDDSIETDRNTAARVAAGMYANEPCRICGRVLSVEDVNAGAVFAGYSQNGRSRAAHVACWAIRPPKGQWAFPA